MARRISFRTILTFGTSLLSCSLFGCAGKVVDLGQNDLNQPSNGPIYSTGIPTALVDAGGSTGNSMFRIVEKELNSCFPNYPDMSGFAVSAGRLYWISWSLTDTNNNTWGVRSCDVDNCLATMTASNSVPVTGGGCSSNLSNTWMQVDDTRVYWADTYSGTIDLTTAAGGSTVVSVVPLSSIAGVAVDHGRLYFGTQQNTVLTCNASDCTGTIERFAMTPPDGVRAFVAGGLVGQDEDHIYLVDSQEFTPGSWRMIRIAKNTSASFEVILPEKTTEASGFAFRGDSVYWIERVLAGQLLSCPKSGCVGSPTALMTGLNNPTAVAVDDKSLYVLEPTLLDSYDVGGHMEGTVSRPGRILKCSIAGCLEPTVLYTTSDEAQIYQLVVDDRFVYVAGTTCTRTAPSPSLSGCSFIEAIPK